MTSARSLYRFAVVFTAAAVAALLAATALALTTVAFHGPNLSAVIEACRDALSPSFSWPAVAVVLLATLSVLALTLAVRSVVRQARDVRRYLEQVEVVEPLAVNDVVVLLVADERPQAFCAGWIRPRVYVSTGALIALDDDELQAVLAHEVHHQRRRDPLRLLMARAVSDAFFFLPALRRLSQRYAALAELAADDAAVAAVGDRSVLASALLAFGERREPDVVVGIAPERVDHLFGDPARWELPTWLMLGALFTLTGLLAMGAATAAASSMSLLFVLAQLCGLLLAAFPVVFVASLIVAPPRRLRAAYARVTSSRR